MTIRDFQIIIISSIIKDTMFFIIKRLFELRFITPFYEYFVHLALHDFKSSTHKQHHIDFFNKNILTEYWLLPIIAFFYYIENYHLALGTSQYLLIHTISHKAPHLLPGCLKNHHVLHHRNKNYNYSVSSTWPDYIFGSLLKN